jgi:hypothetical protein
MPITLSAYGGISKVCPEKIASTQSQRIFPSRLMIVCATKVGVFSKKLEDNFFLPESSDNG